MLILINVFNLRISKVKVKLLLLASGIAEIEKTYLLLLHSAEKKVLIFTMQVPEAMEREET